MLIKIICAHFLYRFSWCSGYHICLTHRRSPVRNRAKTGSNFWNWISLQMLCIVKFWFNTFLSKEWLLQCYKLYIFEYYKTSNFHFPWLSLFFKRHCLRKKAKDIKYFKKLVQGVFQTTECLSHYFCSLIT